MSKISDSSKLIKDHTLGMVRKYTADLFEHTKSGFGGSRSLIGGSSLTSFTRRSESSLEEIYMGSWLSRKIIDLPAHDAIRNWVTINAENDSQEKVIVDEFERIDLKQNCEEMLKLNRVYGGAILVNIFESELDESLYVEPINEKRIKPIVNGIVLSPLRCRPFVYENSDLSSKRFSKPLLYRAQPPVFGVSSFQNSDNPGLNRTNTGQIVSFDVHHSRLATMHGAFVPMHRKFEFNSFGQSIFEYLEDTLIRHESSRTSGSDILRDFVIKIYKMGSSKLMDNVAKHGPKAIKEHFDILSDALAIHKIFPISESDEFSKIGTPINGLVELMSKFEDDISSASGIPKSILYGNESGGLGQNSGKNDIDNYSKTISGIQKNDLFPVINRVKELICLNKGIDPMDVRINFNPLSVETKEEQINNMNKTMDAIQKLWNMGVADEVSIVKFLNKDGGNRILGMTLDEESVGGGFEDEELLENKSIT